MFGKRIYNVLTFVFALAVFILFVYVILFSQTVINSVYSLGRFSFIIIIASSGICLAVGLLINKMICKAKNHKYILAAVVFLAVVLRGLWVYLVPTALFSDFEGYVNYAADIAKGQAWYPNQLYEIFPFTVGYPLILSLWFKLFGSTLISGKIFNIACSAALIILTYKVAEFVFDRSVALFAAIMTALWPAQIMYTSVMATEHIGILFFMASILLVYLTEANMMNRKKYLFSILLGVFICLSKFVRPITVLLLPAVIIYFYFILENNMPLKKSLIHKTKIAAAIMIGFLISTSILNALVLHTTGVNLKNSSSGFNLLIGTNFKYGGLWNPEDAGIIEEYNHDARRIHENATAKALERIVRYPGQFVQLVFKHKMTHMWGNEGYGYYWSTAKLLWNNKFVKFLDNHPILVHSSYQLFYLVILIMSVISCLFFHRNRKPALLLLFILALITAHLFLEVQSRYHFPAIPLMIILCCFGYQRLYPIILEKMRT